MKTSLFRNNKQGFSLVEIVLALSIFTIVLTTMSIHSIDASKHSFNLRQRIAAKLLVQEMANAIQLVKNDSWESIISNEDPNPKHLAFNNDHYEIIDGLIDTNGITLGIIIYPVHRDSLGNIVDIPLGDEDINTKRIRLEATWRDIVGRTQQMVRNIYINDWNASIWKETTEAEFNTGTHNQTLAQSVGDGEVSLESAFYADWCNPQISVSTYDLPGQGVAKSIYTIAGKTFAGTGNNASGISFINSLIDNSDPPVVTVEGTFDGYKTNAIFGETNYAYIATDTNAKEGLIIDITSLPYTEVGYLDGPTATNGSDIFIDQNKAYLGQGDKLHVFDVANKNGSRPLLGSITLGGGSAQITEIVVKDNYAYVGLNNDTINLVIIDITDPANMSTASTTNINSQSTADIFVSSDSSRTYLATATDTGPEFFILDSTIKTVSLPIISSVDSSTSISGITVIADHAILGGTGGQEYEVIDIQDENNPIMCGSLDVPTGINDIASIVAADETPYSYILTGDSNNELQIIKGGPGGGGPSGNGYVETGDYESQVYDAQTGSINYYSIDWKEQVPATTDIQLQMRTGPTSDLSSINWFGPDGTSSTFFTENSGGWIPTIADNNQFVQYKVFFTSDTISTPLLEEINIRYQYQ